MKILNKARSFLMKKDDGKDVLDRKKFFLCIGSIISVGVLLLIVLKPSKDSSVVINSITPIEHDKENDKKLVLEESEKVTALFKALKQREQKEPIKKQPRQSPQYRSYAPVNTDIEYKAQQVIERKGPDSLGLPLGTNLIGKLLTSIDTRETDQLYKVILPYGGNGKNGGHIPKDAVLFGNITYPGKGKKVFLRFSQALLPDGEEVKLNAQALSSKDYSPGLNGDYHSKIAERVASTLGLSMLSVMTDTLTERQITGAGETIVSNPKATPKNALYQGISKVTEIEAQRQAAALNSDPEYVTISAGKEMIVHLLETYYDNQ